MGPTGSTGPVGPVGPTGHGSDGGPALSPMLHRLAAERATGVLLREHGTLYLTDGQVVHAESPKTPGLDVLLTTGGVLDAEIWQDAVAQAGARRRVGRFLVDSGRVTEGALELCHMGALFDAAYFVLGPSSDPARFRYGATHWLGPVRPVPVTAIERETVRRRELLHRIWPDPATDSAPLIRTDHRAGARPGAGADTQTDPWVGASADTHTGPQADGRADRRPGRQARPPVPARRVAVLGQVDGVRTAADIARSLGRPAFHTLVDLHRLAAAGFVTTVRPDPPTTPTPIPATPDAVSALLAHPSADPDVALLRRLRDALGAL